MVQPIFKGDIIQNSKNALTNFKTFFSKTSGRYLPKLETKPTGVKEIYYSSNYGPNSSKENCGDKYKIVKSATTSKKSIT